MMNLREKQEAVALYFYEKTDKKLPFYVWINKIAEEHMKETNEIIKHKQEQSMSDLK